MRRIQERQDPPGRNRQKCLKIFLPLAAQSRYPCAWKMAYFSTATAPERRNLTGKNRVWDFFRLSNETHPASRSQPAQPRRKIRPTATRSASGIPYWPSRDPIGEEGGGNLYGFNYNNPIGSIDNLGLWGEADHKELTHDSFVSAVGPDTLETTKQIALRWIVAANRSQDRGDAFEDYKRHFNRRVSGSGPKGTSPNEYDSCSASH